MQIERGFLLQQSATVRARIERELNATLYLMTGLAAYVSAHEDLLESERIEGMLRALYGNSSHLTHVALAPDNVLRYIYPIEGNEAAIGLRYPDRPDQWPAVRRAMEERRTVLSGPIELVQGGQGIVVRTPVYLDDDRYWGVLTLVIDPDSLFQAAGLAAVRDGYRHGLRWAPDSDGAGRLIRGSADAFDGRTVLQSIRIPGGEWELATRYLDETPFPTQVPLTVFGLIMAALAAWIAFLLVDRRIRSAWQAEHDPLTSLPNRRRFRKNVEQAMRARSPGSGKVAVAYIDLNGFKAINDTHGHSIGDRVLSGVGRHFLDKARDDELVARIGGDEFAVLIDDVESSGQVRDRVRELIRGIGAAAEDLAPDCDLGAAAGVAFYPEDGSDLETLLTVADRRMYRDKRAVSPEGAPSS